MREHSRVHAVILCLAFHLVVGGWGAPAAAQVDGWSLEPLPIESAVGTKTFSLYAPLDLSPDGGHVALTVLDPLRAQSAADGLGGALSRNGDIYVIATATGSTRNLTGGLGNNWYPAWSPDGAHLAFYSDRDGEPALWIWSRDTDTIRRASSAVAVPIGVQWPRWTPDGQHVVVPVLTPDAEVTDITAGRSDVASRSDSGATVVVYDSPVSTDASTPPTSRPSRTPTSPRPKDLAIIDPFNGSTRRLGLPPEIGGNVGWFQPSPTGAELGFTSMTSLQMTHDIYIVDLRTLEYRRVASDVPMWLTGATVSWSPDAAWLAYTTRGADADGACYLLSTSGGQPRRLTSAPHPNFGSEYRPPLWDERAESVYLVGADDLWSVSISDGRVERVGTVAGRRIRNIVYNAEHPVLTYNGRELAIVLETHDPETERAGFYRLDPQTGRADLLVEENRTYGSAVRSFPDHAIASSTGKVVFRSQSASDPEEIWMLDLDGGGTRQISTVQQGLEGTVFGTSVLVRWRTSTGERLRGALLLPSGYESGRRYPLIVYPYGGSSFSGQVHTFGLSGPGVENMQLFATRGYAVLLPDTRLRAEAIIPDLVEQVVAAADRVVEMGIADPARLGLMGHSYGGYNTIAIIANSNRFRAAVARAGFGSTLGQYGEMRNGSAVNALLFERPPKEGYIDPGLGNVGAAPWERFDLYVATSPLFTLDAVETPLLLVHGTKDRRVADRFSAEVYIWMSRMGKRVTFARYVGEDHTERYWSYPNQFDYIRRVLDWFDSHLKRSGRPRDPAVAPSLLEPPGR